MTDENCARFLLTNARSLEPKTESLLDAFSSLNLHFSCVTETWYKGGAGLKKHLADVEGAAGVRVLHHSRDGRVKARGGGVAFAFNTSTCNFKKRQLRHVQSRNEVLCAVGRVGKIGKNIAVFVVYVPPTMRVAEFKELGEALAAEIAAIKTSYKAPGIIVTGDFNHRDIVPLLNETEDMQTIITGPTRGNNTIDLVHTNMAQNIVESLVIPPLCTANGLRSDHKCVFAAAKFPAQRDFKWEVRYRRLRDVKREEAFASDMAATDWSPVRQSDDVNFMANHLEDVVQGLTDKHFPLVRVRKRSNESPWITRHIRRLWKKKIREYKSGGKSDKWWRIDTRLQELITNSREAFVEKMLDEGNSGKSFYAATRKLSAANPAQPWSVKDVFPGASSLEVGREVLGYFGGIASTQGDPIPDTARVPGGLPTFTKVRTEAVLRKAKRSDSMVKLSLNVAIKNFITLSFIK